MPKSYFLDFCRFVLYFFYMNPQDINVNRLDTLGIYELRELGRQVGVPRPTALRRDDLVTSIKTRLEHGDIQKNPARGRRPRAIDVDFSKIVDDDGLNSYFNSVLSQIIEPQVQDGSNAETRAVSGYIHRLPNGAAVLIGVDLNGYPVATKLLRVCCLRTGDFVEGKAVYNSSRNSFLLEEISRKCENIRFDNIEGVRPSKSCVAYDANFMFGERVLFVTPKPFDRIEDMMSTAAKINNTYIVALLIDETDDSATYLQDVMQDVYLTKVNYSIQKQTMACLLALFRAKMIAEQGKNVVLFVDSLNKLFKVYNNSAYPDGRIDPAQINLAPLVDLKTFLMSSRALKNGGSLTVIAYVNVASNPIEDYIYNEFADLAQKIVKKI